MANPMMYYNKRNYAVTVGNVSLPAKAVFTWHPDNNGITIASAINTVVGSATIAQIEVKIGSYDILKAYGTQESLGYLSRNVQGAWNGDGKHTEVPGGLLSGYRYLVKRNEEVYYGTTHVFTLPPGAQVIVAGNSTVGASNRGRLAIIGFAASDEVWDTSPKKPSTAYSFTRFESTIKLSGSQTWWVDTGVHVHAYSNSRTISLSGLVAAGAIGVNI